MTGRSYSAPERLEDQQYVVLLLRLLVHRDGHIVHGDAGGPEMRGLQAERWVHFHGPDGLLGAVQAWLADRPDNQNPSVGANA